MTRLRRGKERGREKEEEEEVEVEIEEVDDGTRRDGVEDGKPSILLSLSCVCLQRTPIEGGWHGTRRVRLRRGAARGTEGP